MVMVLLWFRNTVHLKLCLEKKGKIKDLRKKSNYNQYYERKNVNNQSDE